MDSPLILACQIALMVIMLSFDVVLSKSVCHNGKCDNYGFVYVRYLTQSHCAIRERRSGWNFDKVNVHFDKSSRS